MKGKWDYWLSILLELDRIDDPNYEFRYIDSPRQRRANLKKRRVHMQPLAKTNDNTTGRYYLGKNFHEIYITERELDCVRGLVQGKTYIEIGKQLKLSPRTIEFYVKNIKVKVGCKTQKELLNTVLSSDLTSFLED